MKFKGYVTKLRTLEDLVEHLPEPPDLERLEKLRKRGTVLLWGNGSVVITRDILKDEEINDRPEDGRSLDPKKP
jgi:hypothetical protein